VGRIERTNRFRTKCCGEEENRKWHMPEPSSISEWRVPVTAANEGKTKKTGDLSVDQDILGEKMNKRKLPKAGSRAKRSKIHWGWKTGKRTAANAHSRKGRQVTH